MTKLQQTYFFQKKNTPTFLEFKTIKFQGANATELKTERNRLESKLVTEMLLNGYELIHKTWPTIDASELLMVTTGTTINTNNEDI